MELVRDISQLSSPFSRFRPGVILLDDSFLGHNTNALHEIRERMPEASLIYIASAHSHEHEKWARAAGVSYYLSKPIEPSLLISVLTSFLLHRDRSKRVAP